MLGDTVGISKVLEAKNSGKLSLSYHKMRLMGKGGVSIGGVVCFHALGFHGWICQNCIRLGSWLLLQSTDGCVKCQGINLVCCLFISGMHGLRLDSGFRGDNSDFCTGMRVV